jgi:ATP-dependent Clp protease ATP-binding subunit ClpB
MRPITDIQLSRLAKCLEERNINLDITNDAVNSLAQSGYNPLYGARPLKRVIQSKLQDPLAELLLTGGIKDGQRVIVDIVNGELTFNGVNNDNHDEPKNALIEMAS